MGAIEQEVIDAMINRCQEQLSKSYSVYSKFPVAAALLTDCGQTFTGCNVENASYGLTICAERTAAVKAVSEGFTNLKACFILAGSADYTAPCGACRQFLVEFNLDMEIYLIARDGKYKRYSLRELVPLAFTPRDLGINMARLAEQ